MATISVVAADFIEPTGPLNGTLFPNVSNAKLVELIVGWLGRSSQLQPVLDAADNATADRLVTAYTLYLAFTAVYTRMSAEPITVTVAEKGGHGYTTQQIENMKELAAQYLADYNAIVDATIVTSATPYGPTQTRYSF